MNQLRKQRTTRQYIKLGNYVEYWYKTYKQPKHEKSTIAVQLNYIRTHIKNSEMGNMNLTAVRTPDIQSFIKDLLKCGNKCKLKNLKTCGQGLAGSTVKKIRSILIAAFKQALKEKLVDENYAEHTEPVQLPQTKNKKYTYFSRKDEAIFLEKSKNHKFHLAYKLLFVTGCRRSEILGLSWKDINFKDKYMTIRQVLVIPDKVPLLKLYPKTKASIRRIPLPEPLIKALKIHFQKQKVQCKLMGKHWSNENNLVFVTKTGDMYNPKNFSQNFKKALTRFGLNRQLHVHSTRHTFATNMLQLNTPISDVQELGGWSSADMLLDIYAHAVKQSHRKAINRLYEKSLRD